jgi:hypothetical protein
MWKNLKEHLHREEETRASRERKMQVNTFDKADQ